MDLSGIKSGLDQVSSLVGYLDIGLGFWKEFQTKRIEAFAKGAAKEVGGNEKFKFFLSEAALDPRKQEIVTILMEKMRQSECVWASLCLGILLGRGLNNGLLEIEEMIFADILSRLTDIDLDFFTRLRPLALKKHEINEKKHPKSNSCIRIEQADLKDIKFCEDSNLLLVRMRVDRLTMTGVFSGDAGGYGLTGFAHGSFIWHEITESFYQFVMRNRLE